MKLGFVLTALAVFVLLSVVLNATRQESQPVIDKPDFFFKDFAHKTTVEGKWNGKDYVVKMKIRSLDIDLKLVFNEKGDFVRHFDSGTREDEQTDQFQICPDPRIVAPHAHIYNNQTCKPRVPDFITRTWNKFQRNTVVMGSWAWSGVTWGVRASLDTMVTTAGKACHGVMLTAEWTWDKVVFTAEWTWETVLWMTDRSWERVTWLAEWIWYQMTLMARGMRDGATWTVNVCIASFNWVTEVASNFYPDYLQGHVANIKTYTAGLSYKTIIAGIVGLSAILLIRFVIRRRQARLEQEAAEAAAAAKKPIWRPKQKKKKRKNQKDW